MPTDFVDQGFEKGTEEGLCILQNIGNLSLEDLKTGSIWKLVHSFVWQFMLAVN